MQWRFWQEEYFFVAMRIGKMWLTRSGTGIFYSHLEEVARLRKAIPKSVRRAVYEKYGGHCAYCGCEIPFKGFNVDHLHCLKHYEYLEEFTGIDVNSIENLMPACGSCNRYKSTMDLETFRKQLQKIPDRLQRDVCTYNIALRFGMIQECREPIRFYFEMQEGKDED
jgi:hypothetical protein